jgi:hypothetical protein
MVIASRFKGVICLWAFNISVLTFFQSCIDLILLVSMIFHKMSLGVNRSLKSSAGRFIHLFIRKTTEIISS